MIHNYQPKQIISFKNLSSVRYQTYVVTEQFSDDVCYFWHLESDLSEPFEYLILPDGCIDIIFERSDGIFHSPMMTKPYDSALRTKLDRKSNYWGIRFKPGRVFRYIPISLNGLNEDFTSISDLFVTRTKEYKSLLSFLIENRKDPIDVLDIEQIMKADYSSRHKRRLFLEKTGFSQTKLQKIIRFQNVLANQNSYLDIYYDQPHFIKHFKELTSYTPTQFFSLYVV